MQLYNLFVSIISFAALCSCTVTNSIYVNDPVPLPKGKMEMHLGGGTGHKAKVDSVANNGNIAFSRELEIAPILFTSGQYGITDQLNARFSLHLPYIIGGFGLRGGIQYSFFPRHTLFNAAIGADFGFVLAKDSIRILGSASELDTYTDGAINADFFIPLSYSFSENYRIILTARYSLNAIYVRYNMYENKTYAFKPQLPSIALGVRLNKIYIEGNISRYKDIYIPNFGLVYIFSFEN